MGACRFIWLVLPMASTFGTGPVLALGKVQRWITVMESSVYKRQGEGVS